MTMNQIDLNGIYLIKNKVNNKFYVGSASKSFKYRWNEHKRKLNNDRHYNRYLQSSWNKYTKDNFEFIILEIVEKIEDIIKREQYYIDTLIPEYNLSPTANSVRGFKHSDEAKLKMSKAKLGKVTWNTGRKWSEESKLRISKQRTGKKLSESHKNNIKEAMKFANLEKTIIATKKRQNKKIYCVEIDMLFESQLQAASFLQLSYGHMSFCINKGKKVKGYTLKRVNNE